MHPFEFHSPETIPGLLELLRLPSHKVIAGGTDLIPQMRSRKLEPGNLIEQERWVR